MSRIDEALRRAGGSREKGALPSPQAHFVSAWAETGPKLASETTPAGRAGGGDGILSLEPGPMLPALNTAWGERLASAPGCDPALVEEFRRLAATLHKAQATSGIRIIMVTSAVPSDGKTLTAINLALVLSGSYNRRVLLVDADLRRPSIGQLAGLSGTSGLSDALRARTEQKLALIPLAHGLSLLPSGPPDRDPIGGLTSPRMRKILEEAIAHFDWVIIDGPPVEPLADANLLVEIVDGALFVVRAGVTPYPVLQRALDALGRERVLGVVLNGVESSSDSRESYYYAADTPAARAKQF